MASVASRIRPLPSIRSLPSSFVLPALVLLGLLAVSFYLRTNSLGESLWMDEGLSIGIASQPLFDIPGVLRVDGSPPLYYMALSAWMDVVGNGPAETQGLSVLVGMLAVPGGLWAGWTLFGRRAGLICAALCAVNPFLTAYSQETRMYSLMLVLSLLATAAFLHVFAFGRRKYLPLFSVLLALMLYTHNWGLFLAAGLLCALVPCWYVSEVRSSFWKDAMIGFGFAGLLYVPWLPTLLHQVQHTGAPWLNPPAFGAPVQISKSLLGGGTPTVALLLAGGSGIAAVIARRVEDRERTAVLAGAVTVLATLAVAWLVSQVSPAWTTRYLGVLLGPMLLIAALGLARAGALGMVALVIVLGIWAIPRSYGLENKSNASDLRKEVATELRAGDLVLSMQPEQGPLLAYHLEDLGGAPKLRFGSPIGESENDRVMDWTDAYDKMRDATTAANLEPLLANLPPGGRVLIVHPVTSRADDWDAPWTQLVRRRAAQWGAALEGDKRFETVGAVPRLYRRATRIGVRGVLYEKTTTEETG
ncbi:MAG: mannosyltransferase [Thermoleophilaceae bacterium]|nr:mannosyltransferase [Thermoleophilaceae bacterium]